MSTLTKGQVSTIRKILFLTDENSSDAQKELCAEVEQWVMLNPGFYKFLMV